MRIKRKDGTMAEVDDGDILQDGYKSRLRSTIMDSSKPSPGAR